MIAIDWVSSLRRMTSFSQRNLNSPVDSASSAPFLETARRMEEERQKELERQAKVAAAANQKAAQTKKTMSSATKGMTELSVQDGEKRGNDTRMEI